MSEMERVMAKVGVLVTIGRAAVEVDRVREACAAARAKRQSYTHCGVAEQWDGNSCWKDWQPVGDHLGHELPDRSDWCHHCLARQEAHEAYVLLRNKLGGMRAGLARRCTHHRRLNDE